MLAAADGDEEASQDATAGAAMTGGRAGRE
jgi:hypothetical protein